MTAGQRFPMPLLMPAERAAALIARGLARQRPLIAFPLALAAASWLVTALPARLGDALLARMAAALSAGYSGAASPRR
jgi:hypothetical protein